VGKLGIAVVNIGVDVEVDVIVDVDMSGARVIVGVTARVPRKEKPHKVFGTRVKIVAETRPTHGFRSWTGVSLNELMEDP
jgi:hypothetical protein